MSTIILSHILIIASSDLLLLQLLSTVVRTLLLAPKQLRVGEVSIEDMDTIVFNLSDKDFPIVINSYIP